jgi:hypothetical protein
VFEVLYSEMYHVIIHVCLQVIIGSREWQ